MEPQSTAESANLNPRKAPASHKKKAIAAPAPSKPAKAKGKAKQSAKPARQTPAKRERRVNFVHQTVDLRAPIESVQPHPKNANEADQEQLAESVDANGFIGTILVHASTGNIIAGNNRWKLLKQRGETTCPVTFADVDDETAERILAADNATAAGGKRDPTRIETLLASITGGNAAKLKGTGYRGVSGIAEMMDRIRGKSSTPATPFDDSDEDRGGEFSGQDEHPGPDPEDGESSSRSRSDTKSLKRHPLPIVLDNAEKREWDGWKILVGKKNDGFCFQQLMRIYRRAQDEGLLEQLRAEPEE